MRSFADKYSARIRISKNDYKSANKRSNKKLVAYKCDSTFIDLVFKNSEKLDVLLSLAKKTVSRGYP